MIRIRTVFVFGIFIIIVFVTLLSYSIIILNNAQKEVASSLSVEEKILLKLSSLPDIYYNYNGFENITKLFFINLKIHEQRKSFEELWREANYDVSFKLYNMENKNLGNYLLAMKTAQIIKVDLDTRGTQLKLLLTLEGDQLVVYKPKWYNKDKIIDGPVYAGKDRYNSEILAFYLSAILNKPLAPLAVQRTLHFKSEVLPYATARLLNTYLENDKNFSCFYGECLYCKKSDPICENSLGNVDGVVIFNINKSLTTHRSPWQRTYKNNIRANWQKDINFCKSLTKISKTRLYDLVDTAIFDFLIQNGDRHHYETLNERVVFIDNGKGLGNPYIHHIDILAPLYQCCILRETMWNRLKLLSGGLLKDLLKSVSNITDVISELHLDAIDKRLLIIFATVEYCKVK